MLHPHSRKLPDFGEGRWYRTDQLRTFHHYLQRPTPEFWRILDLVLDDFYVVID